MGKVTGAQIRAARAFLSWTIDDLRKRSGISAPTIRAIEHQSGLSRVEPDPKGTRAHRQQMRDASVQTIVATMEGAGINFLNDNGGALVGIRSRVKAN